MKVYRKIVEIDEEKCNGCGQCVRDCAEGAISIIDGKAKVLADFLCDGLGACLAGCPQDALHIVEREAAPFDEQAVHKHLAAASPTTDHSTPKNQAGQVAMAAFAAPAHSPDKLACGCSSSLARTYDAPAGAQASGGPCTGASPQAIQQRHWPVKLRLVPPTAAFLRHADIVVAADCAATASAAFHSWTAGKVVLIACPKFEDPQAISAKVAAIVAHNAPKSLTVLRMEVPCCSGLVGMCQQGVTEADGGVAVNTVTMACNGAIG